MNTFKSLEEADLKGKIVLVRVDHNVVKKGIIHDPYRIDATIGTLFYILAKGGKFILMTHVGRPKDKKTGSIAIDEGTSVLPIVRYLESKLHIRLGVPNFEAVDNKGYSGIAASINYMIKDLKENKIDGIYLPNTRWFSGEEAKGEEQEKFASQLASLADVFVNDAFGSWQAHASTAGVTRYLPSYAGFLMQKELKNLDKTFNPQHPFVAVVAGNKFNTKIDSLTALLKTADYLVLGGVIYNAYLCAKYGICIKGIEEEDILQAKQFVETCRQYPEKLIEMPYIIESDIVEDKKEGSYRVRDIRRLKQGDSLNYVLDVDGKSFEEKQVLAVFSQAKTIFVNAVMGYMPHFDEGTIALYALIDKNKEAVKLYGGGDTMQELKRLLPGLYLAALDNPKYYIFTGGGAVLKAIQEGSYMGLEPVKALCNK
ncbi:MAG TPA: phosphoglycerate kinase [Bacteroidales bacterium]|nr:phosphoglycerate kinase [Bacteroidales bacterium]HOR81951.1 phosphoglycerate kinase [Bacteroidales bacterium]HPJ91474.1 phosphoglycerate kinase [Bacteroidales bacterium]